MDISKYKTNFGFIVIYVHGTLKLVDMDIRIVYCIDMELLRLINVFRSKFTGIVPVMLGSLFNNLRDTEK